MSWPSITLSDHCDTITKGTTPTSVGFEFSDFGIPFVRVQNISAGTVKFGSSDLYINPETHAALKRSKIVPGDVLVSIAGTIGRCAVVPDADAELNCNQAVAIIRPQASIDRKFLLHWLSSDFAIEQIRQSKVTATIANLSLGQLGALKISLPPLDEQKRIAAILDQADELRRKRQRTIARLNELGQAIFYEMFEGTAAAEWPSIALAEAVKTGTIVTYGIVQAGDEISGGIPYIRTGDIKNGRIALESLRHTTPEIASRFERSRVRSGEIVMSIRATVGTVAFVPPQLDGANLTQGTARIAPSERALRWYLIEYLRSAPVQAWIQKQVKGATFREITLTRLRELPVKLPPIELQNRFSNILHALESQLNAAFAAFEMQHDLFKSLQNRAFRGEL